MCLIEAGADVNKLKDDGCSALHAAVSRGQPEIIKILLQAGADDPGLWVSTWEGAWLGWCCMG